MSAAISEKMSKGLSLFMNKQAVKGVLQGKVLDIDGYKSCTVEIAEGLELYDVRLQATTGTINDMAAIKPKVGSVVLVGILENVTTEAFVISFSEVEEVTFKIGTAELVIKNNKIKLEAAGFNLKTELSNFIDEVNKIIVLYGTSPNVAQLTAIKLRFQQMLF
jgi:hypothetical protein